MIDKGDLGRIALAIAEAEKRTAAEIAVVVGRKAGGYHLVPISWAAFAALALPALLLAIFNLTAHRLYEIELIVFGALAFMLSVGSYRHRLVPGRMKRRRAHEAAREQFMARRISRTQARSSVLLYVALAERYVELVPGSGISEQLDDALWKPVIVRLTEGIKHNRTADGIVAAVENCGAILAQHFPPRGENRDELGNEVVLL
jgi:putative membrane protein